MTHPEQMRFVERVREIFPAAFTNARVLEIGSLNLNGTVRDLFTDCDYTGIDVGPGPGVDVVYDGKKIWTACLFDTVISCECMEHNPYWRETFHDMFRLCKPGGIVIMTCASEGRAEHGTTRSMPETSPLTVRLGWNHYRNLTAKDVRSVANLDEQFGAYALFQNWRSWDLYFVGVKASDYGDNRGILRALQRRYFWSNLRILPSQLKLRASLVLLRFLRAILKRMKGR